jgi:BirA family transcriptional regulator, biotin operon repressor / biotin---[acetyl-CoA-carboxylase] ligase
MIIGSNILFFKNLPSTNTHIAGILKNKDLPEGTIVYTNYQLAGRGYSGNSWESEDDKNLLFSFLLRPSFIKPADQFYISMTISLGICDFLIRFIPDCNIKWPNDIYVKNDKIAGILIESSIIGEQIESTIAGIGLNINQDKFSDSLPNPVSLNMLTGTTYDRNGCLTQLGKDLDKRYKQLIAGNMGHIKQEYINRLYRLNKWSDYKDSTGLFTGRIVTVNDSGQIVIERKNAKIKEYSFKEIEFIL